MSQRPLIGTSLDQVSTNGMLGDLAFQDARSAYIEKIRGAVNLNAIDKTTLDTAVDVFVYDTRKDSDGGAWRKRTQNTSWYNETLNTATRGSRREFPATAVLVLTSSSLTIYDGDNPDIPMWMVFNTTAGSMLRYNSLTCMSILNGELWVGSVSGNGLFWINFLKDTSRWITGSTSYGGFFIKGYISRRNESGDNYYNNIAGASNITIASANINDVAMTVLPNAPIDSTTGLSVPTIAVATTSGVSVIKDDGSVESTDNADIIKIGFIKGDRIAYGHRGGQSYEGRSVNIAPFRNSLSYSFYQGNSIPHFGNSDLDAGNILGIGDGNIYGYAERGIRRIFENEQNRNNGMVNYITTSYNTGWMQGDIKGAFLSDTSTTSLTGIELNQYGNFSSTTGWESRSASWTISGGTASVSSGAGYQLLGVTSGNLTNGKKYAITVNVTSFTAGRLEFSQANSSNIQFNLSSTGLKTLIITYTGSTGYALGIYGYGDASYAFTIDDLYVRELSELDRSVNNTGLAVYGTITKTAVATGSDLVSYSGFNASNGLTQPYNSAFDFGTGDYYMSVWAYGGSTDQALMIREEPQGDNNGAILIFQYNGYYAFYSRTSGTPTWTSFLSTAPYGNYWSHIYLVRRGGVLQGYVNGNLVGSTTFTGTVSNGNAQLSIGKRIPGVNTQYFTGQIALAKIGAGAPSAEQIKKIYEDEKELFMENSKSTLYGSSNIVTGIAYDDTTKLLHVGTSSGRSEFQGLRRINNTTTAVTTAINASNGLIAEQ